MGALQRFSVEGEPRPPSLDARMDPMEMDGMAGLVMGLTVSAVTNAAPEEAPPERTIHLWTSRTPGVLGEHPALSFVATDGREPPRDTLVTPGSPLVLTQRQPSEIVVHNRLDFPISVHWHGLEVRSRYDGVAWWSGRPGATRPPVAPEDSLRVSITPPRAGTFIYHVHGEVLLRDGEPVLWRPVAKDGADLPATAHLPRTATVEIGVGETYDFTWTPEESGVYVLEVETVHYSAAGLPPSLQRVAFGVGEVTEAALADAARVSPPSAPPADTTPVVAMSEAELRRFEGVYTGPGLPIEFTVAMVGPDLTMSVMGQAPGLLAPLGDGVFRWEDPAALRAGRPLPRVHFSLTGEEATLNVFGMSLARTSR